MRRRVIRPPTTVCSPSDLTLSIDSVAPVVRTLSVPYGMLMREIVVDLSATQWVTPAGLVGLVAGLSWATERGTTVRVVCPEDGDVCSYLGGCGVLQRCAEIGVNLSGSQRHEGRTPSMGRKGLVLTAFDTDDEVGTIRRRVGPVLERVLGGGDDEWVQRRGAFRGAVHEMTTNVVLHTDSTGFVLAQKYVTRRGEHFVEFAVGDAGPGIASTLREAHPGLQGVLDHEVLDRMVRDGLSRKGGGAGYQTVRDFTSRNRGRFDLRSGDAKLTLRRGQRAPRASSLGWTWPGTVLSGSITCPR